MEYAISDIHGNSLTFRYMVEEKIQLKKEDTLYLLGDYIDRGPDSKGVIDYIFELQAAGFRVLTLRGNHEQLLIDSMEDSDSYALWVNNGGVQTMQSFQIKTFTELEQKYLDFFMGLVYYVETEHYFLVHAGFNFNRNDFLEDTYSMLWIRHWHHSLDKSLLNGKTIIHGHTPISLDRMKEMAKFQEYPVLDIDGGCFMKRNGYGYLCAYNLTTRELLYQSRLD